MEIKNEDVLDMFQGGNKDMENAVLNAGVSKASMQKAQAWRTPSKLPEDFILIGKVLQTFVTA